MAANQKKKQIPKQQEERPPETIEERVHRHISDINSKITDDDIKSVKTELDIRKDSEDQPEEENKAKKKQKRSSTRNKKGNDKTDQEKQTTPWDLLSEGYDE
jgi:hypothetical protein